MMAIVPASNSTVYGTPSGMTSLAFFLISLNVSLTDSTPSHPSASARKSGDDARASGNRIGDQSRRNKASSSS
ncbi:MAG: Uncharacterised protein [Methanobacteriota archaeon]|nr:MAG: Uncharacterised protein [Euryarchaeota archaeon]